MPNWCYSAIAFRGDIKDISRLVENIHKAIQYDIQTKYRFCNFWKFFEYSGFSVDDYRLSVGDPINFRGSFIQNYPLTIEVYPEYAITKVQTNTAWAMDYNVLYLISYIYGVEFSAYSEELGMGFWDKCRNGDEDAYDYDICVLPNIDDLNAAMCGPYSKRLEDMLYCNPFKLNDSEYKKFIDGLDGINYTEEKIPEYDYGPVIHGVYYHLVPGVQYS